MPRDRLTFRQRDVRAAIKAAIEAGLKVSEVTVSPEGEIRIITSADSPSKATKPNPWDEFYENPPALRPGVSRRIR
jgi:hypothetical protein